jgi:hypothetical protein
MNGRQYLELPNIMICWVGGEAAGEYRIYQTVYLDPRVVAFTMLLHERATGHPARHESRIRGWSPVKPFHLPILLKPIPQLTQ